MISYSRLFLSIILVVFFACNKDENKPSSPSSPSSPSGLTPAPDSIADPIKDIEFVLLSISDIEYMTGMVGCGKLNQFLYSAQIDSTSPPTSTTSLIRDTLLQYIFCSFNNTRGIDGFLRNGSININYQNTITPSAIYYTIPDFRAKITFASYKVNGWLIELFNVTNPIELVNITPSNFNPISTNLKWTFKGKVKFTHPSDANRDIVCDFSLNKELLNTNDNTVYFHNTDKTITWSISKCKSTGILSGSLGTNTFTYSINNTQPLRRDFTCAIEQPSYTPSKQFHPFIEGACDFTIGNKTTQHINHNNHINSQPAACDNDGSVKINNTTYSISF